LNLKDRILKGDSMLAIPSKVENFTQFFAIISLILFAIFLVLFLVDFIDWAIADPPTMTFGVRVIHKLDFSWLILSIISATSAFHFFVIKKILEYLRGILFFTQKETE